jgi:hypothetical protein
MKFYIISDRALSNYANGGLSVFEVKAKSFTGFESDYYTMGIVSEKILDYKKEQYENYVRLMHEFSLAMIVAPYVTAGFVTRVIRALSSIINPAEPMIGTDPENVFPYLDKNFARTERGGLTRLLCLQAEGKNKLKELTKQTLTCPEFEDMSKADFVYFNCDVSHDVDAGDIEDYFRQLKKKMPKSCRIKYGSGFFTGLDDIITADILYTIFEQKPDYSNAASIDFGNYFIFIQYRNEKFTIKLEYKVPVDDITSKIMRIELFEFLSNSCKALQLPNLQKGRYNKKDKRVPIAVLPIAGQEFEAILPLIKKSAENWRDAPKSVVV